MICTFVVLFGELLITKVGRMALEEGVTLISHFTAGGD